MIKFVVLLSCTCILFPSEVCSQTEQNRADSLFSLGASSFNSGDYTRAQDYYQQAADLYKASNFNRHLEALLYKGESISYRRLAKESIGELTKVDSLIQLTEDEELKARSKLILGNTIYDLVQHKKALEQYALGITHAEKTSNTQLLNNLIRNAGYTSTSLLEMDRALEFAKKGLNLAKTMNDPNALARAHNVLHLAYDELGHLKLSEEHIIAFLKIIKTTSDTLSIGTAYNNYAGLLRKKGDLSLSTLNFQKALEILTKVGDSRRMARSLEGIAANYLVLGEYEKAIEYAIEAYNTVNPNNNDRLSDTSESIAEIYRNSKKYDKADEWYRKAFTHLEGLDYPLREDNLNTSYGYFNLSIKNYAAVNEIADRILNEPDTATSPILYNIMLYLKSEVALANKNHSQQLEYARKAYSYIDRLELSEKGFTTIRLARSYFNNNHSDSAFFYSDKYFNLLESEKKGSIGFVLESGAIRREARAHKEVAGWYLKRDQNVEKAFEHIEKGKSRVLNNELLLADQNAYDNLEEEYVVKRRNISNRIASLYNKLQATSASSKKDSLNSVIRDEELKRDALLAEIRDVYPELELSQKPDVPTIVEVQHMLDDQTAFVEFAFSGDDLIVFFITEDEVDYKIISTGTEETMDNVLTSHIDAFRKSVARLDEMSVLYEYSEPIMTLTLQELLDEHPSIDKLIISPDGPISKLPFQALRYKDQYLMENYYIKYVPSASIIPLIKNPHRIGSNKFFGFGNQDFEGPVEVSPARNYSLAFLPFAVDEVTRVSQKFSDATVMTGRLDSERIIKSDLSSYSYIHFATHGVVNEQAPSLSKLILTNKLMESDAEEDGHLTIDEISSMKLNADLVVLSACNTGIGKLISGEGLLGMQRSFLTAGASSVVVSLWEVNDQSTVTFMNHYYEHLLALQGKEYGMWEKIKNWFGWYESPAFDYRSKALRAAQLEMIKDSSFKHPRYWAPFIFIGK